MSMEPGGGTHADPGGGTEPRDFEGALRELLSPGGIGRAGRLAHLSGASEAELRVFGELWVEAGPETQRALARELLTGAERDVLLSFDTLFLWLLEDDDDEVRARAIAGLWESEDPRLAERFVETLRDDDSAEVRAQAAIALGSFVELAELGDLSRELGRRIVNALLAVARDEAESADLRRRATASAGYADEERVRDWLDEAIDAPERLLRLGAMRGMGHSADEGWAEAVLRGLDSEDPEMRFEAAHAAGELELGQALEALARIALEEDPDPELRLEAIWALGEIGGDDAAKVLDHLAGRAEDDEMAEAIDDARAAAALHEGEIGPYGRMDLDELIAAQDRDRWDLRTEDDEPDDESAYNEDAGWDDEEDGWDDDPRGDADADPRDPADDDAWRANGAHAEDEDAP